MKLITKDGEIELGFCGGIEWGRNENGREGEDFGMSIQERLIVYRNHLCFFLAP